ncbi:tRNA epoxyqueuosine(34) reductase QueG [Neorhodopirellula pilleata]|uniref:tRNA epoxyqueuosine(34) reductase QueG n=1 Tax=Neorhodopirellula pilleata TaxID=2714738 RepID=UPI001E5BF438|nr:tRNA epoxyqueuosine(34) reductase QueG [Neorhodopirellula pilleata]
MLVDQIRQAAIEEGFAACGITHAVPSEGFADLVAWVDAGYAAGMSYFADRIDAYRHPLGVLPGAKSLIVLAMPYDATDPRPLVDAPDVLSVAPGEASRRMPVGRVARYTWRGTDYHDDIHPKLKRLCRLITSLAPQSKARGVVDTAPLMEREVAQLAGLGWRGKNTLLLNRDLGSYFFLACVLVDIELPADEAHETSHCGTCTACLDACPTDAFVQPHVLDASKCISYLTIESRDPVPLELRSGVGEWLFGCDVCQEVCPWNRKPTRRAMQERGQERGQEPQPEPGLRISEQPQSPTEMKPSDLGRGYLELLPFFTMSDGEFRQTFRKSPLWRPRRRGLLRNASIVLGNVAGPEALPVLRAAADDEDAIVRESAQWAIDQIEGRIS